MQSFNHRNPENGNPSARVAAGGERAHLLSQLTC